LIQSCFNETTSSNSSFPGSMPIALTKHKLIELENDKNRILKKKRSSTSQHEEKSNQVYNPFYHFLYFFIILGWIG